MTNANIRFGEQTFKNSLPYGVMERKHIEEAKKLTLRPYNRSKK